jgi:hypothetical protein
MNSFYRAFLSLINKVFSFITASLILTKLTKKNYNMFFHFHIFVKFIFLFVTTSLIVHFSTRSSKKTKIVPQIGQSITYKIDHFVVDVEFRTQNKNLANN